MDKSASEIYGPLWERIEDLCTAPDSEREEKLKELFDFGMQTKKECEILDLEYQEIRNKNCELEEKLREQYDNLDKQKAQIPEGDIIYHRILCADRYKEFWNLLDCNSQEFLVTADYIYERIKSERGDFSPVIIEFCRIFENELQAKIYIDYVEELAKKKPPIIDLDKKYINLSKAVEDKKRRGKYFLSSTDMINYLAALRFVSGSRGGYSNDMKEYLTRRGWDTISLSDEIFEKQSREYVEKYRNESAHPNILNEGVAIKCMEKTKKIVKKFIQCEKKNAVKEA